MRATACPKYFWEAGWRECRSHNASDNAVRQLREKASATSVGVRRTRTASENPQAGPVISSARIS
jgi:hypothetical protein